MATETFPLFSSFPLELRRKIYLLATPPRIVHVQEETEDQEEFEETFGSIPVHLKLDPTLVHFAFNWRRRIHHHSAQQTLESYGFTNSKVSYRPWEPSAATPEIPLHWLAEQPSVAWELVRKGYLYSKAPIPALLHTCAESRAELMSRGYQLTFRTRSNGPRTWFNFERDVLYIVSDGDYEEYYGSILSGGPWDIGQFHPEDLKRVRKLALNKSGYLLSIQNPTSESAVTHARELLGKLSSVLRLFSGITELLLVEWSQEDVSCWSEFSTERSTSHSWSKCSTEQATVDTTRELWRCVAVEEIDALLWLVATQEKYRTRSWSAGEWAGLLRAHKQQNGGTVPYFQHQQLQLEQRLLELRETMVNDSSDGPAARWEIPRIKAVHVLLSSMASFLSRERQIAWVEFSEMKRKQQKVPSPVSIVPRATIIQTTAMPESFGQDDEEAFAEAHESCCGQCQYDDYLDKLVESEKKWWLEKGNISTPKNEIIY